MFSGLNLTPHFRFIYSTYVIGIFCFVKLKVPKLVQQLALSDILLTLTIILSLGGVYDADSYFSSSTSECWQRAPLHIAGKRLPFLTIIIIHYRYVHCLYLLGRSESHSNGTGVEVIPGCGWTTTCTRAHHNDVER